MISMFLPSSRTFLKFFSSIVVGFLVILLSAECQGHPVNISAHEQSGGNRTWRVTVASWEYESIKGPLIYTIVLFVAGICKIGYHHTGFLSSKVPESCILIALGIGAGAAITVSDASDSLPEFFRPHEFFMFLLPPIILEASYSLHHRAFGENMGSILLLAVLGTVLAAASVGLSLFFLAKTGAMGGIADVGFVEIMVFASLIVAVDPVAVLAVFHEIGVNQNLYFLVFGESLLNDGVTVVLYKVFQAYNVMDEITGFDVVLGLIKFFVVCLGGLVIGVLTGLVSAVLTKVSQQVQVAQPLIIYTLAYLGYLLAESFEFSGIISIVGCGLTQRQYAFRNINDSTSTTIKYLTNVSSTTCEIIIFLFLGLSVAQADHEFHGAFTCWTIGLCLVYRFLIVFGITSLIKRCDTRSVRKIGCQEQFIIAYGGLRGAVCFSLVALLEADDIPLKDMFVTTTLALIIFTVFVQGITIKPLVYLMKIRLAPEKDNSLYAEFLNTVTNHVMTGIEGIIGDNGRNRFREKLIYFNDNCLEPILVKPIPANEQLKQLYDHMLLKEHVRYLKLSGAKTMQNAPDLPHLCTELLLTGTGFCSATEGENLASDASDCVDFTPNPRVDTDKSNGSVREASETKTTKLETGEVNARSLWDLLQRQKNNQFASVYRNRNLTCPDDIGTEIQTKLHKNQRLQQIIQKWAEPESRKKRFQPPSIREQPSTRNVWKMIASAAMSSIPQLSLSTSGELESAHTGLEDKLADDIRMKASAARTVKTIVTARVHGTEVAPRETLTEEDRLDASKSRNEEILSAMLSGWRKRGHSEDIPEGTHF